MLSRLGISREGHLRQGELQGDKSTRVGLDSERAFILRTQVLRNLPLMASSESAIPYLSRVAFGVGAAAEKDSSGMVRRITMLFAGNEPGGNEEHRHQHRRCSVLDNEDWEYDPVVPGRIFFIAPGLQPVRIARFSSVLRTLKLTQSMVTDHFIDSDEFTRALSGP